MSSQNIDCRGWSSAAAPQPQTWVVVFTPTEYGVCSGGIPVILIYGPLNLTTRP
ncbi:hypothetical protein BDV09DRAFT_169931 [Aspergillus tetrazonus]